MRAAAKPLGVFLRIGANNQAFGNSDAPVNDAIFQAGVAVNRDIGQNHRIIEARKAVRSHACEKQRIADF